MSPELLAWASQQARSAKARGELVLVMTHHAMLPHHTVHNETVDSYMEQFLIPNWKQVADTLADAGVTAYLTGHAHTDDIAKYVTADGNTIYDIDTAGLCAYPCAWRTVDITIVGEGAEATYDFEIGTNHIIDAEGIDDVQAYAYHKAGLTRENIEPVLEYLIRLTLADIKGFAEAPYGEGIAGYINKALDIHPRSGDGPIGNLVTAKLKEQLEKVDITEKVNVLGERTLTAKYKDTDEKADVVRLDVSLAGAGSKPSTGVLSIDLTGIPAAIDALVAEIGTKYVDTVGDEGVYATLALQRDLNRFVTSVILAMDKEPLDARDPNSRFLTIANEAYQAFAHGDEHGFVWPGLGIGSAAELAQRREAWRGLLAGDAFADTARNAILDQMKRLTDKDSYPTIADLVSRVSLVPNANGGQSDWFIKFEGQTLGLLDPLKFAAGKLTNIKTAAQLLDVAKSFAGDYNPIPSDLVKQSLATPLVDMQRAFTNDTNIPNDTSWRFHSVLFDACGGSVSPASDLTVENGMLGRATMGIGLPTPTREGATFLGWFTAREDGEPIDAEADYTNVSRIYAHWDSGTKDESVEYACVAGDGQSWHFDATSLEFTFARSKEDELAFEHFTGILVDGRALKATDYDARAGSVVVSLGHRYLMTLATGRHALCALFDDGNDPVATFHVEVPPDTDDGGEPSQGPTDDGHVPPASPDTPSAPSYDGYLERDGGYGHTESDVSGTYTDAYASTSRGHGKVSRIAGATRYDTMASVVSASFPTSEWVVVATGESYADALSAVALAGAHRAPVVLTAPDALTPQACEQMVRLGSTHAIIVGGPSAVSEGVEAAVRELASDTTRIFGADRTATSVAVMRAARSAQGSGDTVVIATGHAFADALSIGPVCYASVSPVILAGPDGMLSEEAVRAIRQDIGIGSIVIVGGTNAVSDAVSDQLGDAYASERLGGPNRFATSAAIASYGASCGLGWTTPYVASGLGFADALAGAAAADRDGSVLLLASSPTDATVDTLRTMRSQVSSVRVLGGPAAVGNATVAAIEVALI